MPEDQWEFVNQDDTDGSEHLGEDEVSAEDSAMHIVADPGDLDVVEKRPSKAFETHWATDHEPDLVEIMEDQHYLPGHPDHVEPEAS